MSTVERATVVANHKAKAEEGVPIHKKIAERIKFIEASKKQKRKIRTVKNLDEYVATKGVKKNLEYFWDYNTVEAVLLACSILICLAGVMFESDRFADSAEGEVSRHAWQRDIITYATILLVFISLIYYGTVFLSETGVLQVACLIKMFADKKKAIHRRQEKKQEENGEYDQLRLSSNPMMQKREESKELQDSNKKLADMAEAASKLKIQLQKEKRTNTRSRGGKSSRKPTKHTKKAFAAKKTSMMDGLPGGEIELAEIGLTPKPEEAASVTPINGGNTTRHIKHKSEQGDFYYEDEKGNTSWDAPTGDGVKIILDDTLKAEKKTKKKPKKKGRAAAAAAAAAVKPVFNRSSSFGMDVFSTAQTEQEDLPAGWEEHEDGTGRTYYHHKHKRESSWVRPDSSGGGDAQFSNPLADVHE